MSITKTGYANGSDLLMVVGGSWDPTLQTHIGGRAAGHCSSCSIQIDNVYSDIQSKPTDPADTGIHKRKRLISQSISLHVSGFHVYDESSNGLQFFLDSAISGEPFIVSFVERRDNATVPLSAYTPFFIGRCVTESSPLEFAAGSTIVYDFSMQADGKPYVLNAANLHNR